MKTLIAKDLIEAQIAALEKTKARLGFSFEKALEMLLACKGKIVISGVGKSGLVGQKIAATLSSTGSPALFLNANEALHGDLGILDQKDVLVMISKSGSTPELIRILPKAQLLEIPCIGIFGNVKTTLAERLDVCLDASVEQEGSPYGLAPMASTTVAMVLGDAIAASLMIAKGKTEADFAANHPAGQLGKNLLLKAEDVMHTGGNLPRIGETQSIKEAVIELTRKNLGGICVVNPEMKLLGFVTDGDIRKYLSRSDDLSCSVMEIMSKNPLCCHPDMNLGQVLNLMENPNRQIYVAPVVDSETGVTVGIIRMHDILGSH
jgi:arabinose-5-phosphate isomerase